MLLFAFISEDTPNYRRSPSIKTVVSTATYKCSSSFASTDFMTNKQNQKSDQDQDFEKRVSRRLETKTQVSRSTTQSRIFRRVWPTRSQLL